MRHEEPVFFEESQGPPPWVKIILLGIPVIQAALSYSQFVLRRPLGNRPMSDTGLAILDIGLLALFIVLWRLRLVTRVYRGFVRVRLWPFANRAITAEEIAHVEVRTYRPIGEYGGWGYRQGGAGDTAYTMSGNRGVQLRLRNGQSVLIGSQRPDEFASALQSAVVVR
jgi:hypothetical protein